MHIHTPHTCTHIPALCTHSQYTPALSPLINLPTGTHSLRARQPLPSHTPNSHTIYPQYTLPTHPHTPTFLTYTFHTHQHPTHAHVSHVPHPLHTHIHTHIKTSQSQGFHIPSALFTHKQALTPAAHMPERHPHSKHFHPQQPTQKSVERRPAPSPGKSASSHSQALFSSLPRKGQ